MLACSGAPFLPGFLHHCQIPAVTDRAPWSASAKWNVLKLKIWRSGAMSAWSGGFSLGNCLMREIQHNLQWRPNTELEFKETGFLPPTRQKCSSVSKWRLLLLERNVYFWTSLVGFLVIGVMHAQSRKNWRADKKYQEKIKMIPNFQNSSKFRSYCIYVSMCFKAFSNVISGSVEIWCRYLYSRPLHGSSNTDIIYLLLFNI